MKRARKEQWEDERGERCAEIKSFCMYILRKNVEMTGNIDLISDS